MRIATTQGIQYTLTSQGLFQEQIRPGFREVPSYWRDFTVISLARGFQLALISLSLPLIIIIVYEQPHIILIINSYKYLVQIYPMMCLLKNAYRKFNLQVYGDPVELFTVSSIIQ